MCGGGIHLLNHVLIVIHLILKSLKDQVSQKGFHCAHLNIRSLSNKYDVLRQTVEECNSNLHVLGISETWLTAQVPDNLIAFNNYICLRNDRNWGNPEKPGHIKKGGGVCIYIIENLNWSTSSYQVLNRSNNNIEIQWVEIINDKCKNFIIANGYRPPDGNVTEFLEYLELSLNEVDLTKYDLFLMGDLII